MAAYRPRCPIMAITRDAQTARQMHLYRGILPIHYKGKRRHLFSPCGHLARGLDIGVLMRNHTIECHKHVLAQSKVYIREHALICVTVIQTCTAQGIIALPSVIVMQTCITLHYHTNIKPNHCSELLMHKHALLICNIMEKQLTIVVSGTKFFIVESPKEPEPNIIILCTS